MENIEMFKIPFEKIDTIQKSIFKEKVDHICLSHQTVQLNSNKFSTYIKTVSGLDKLNGKLEKWYILEFADFIKELNKAIKGVKGTPLTKKDEFEWMDLFEENKKKALELKAEIDRTDKEIDNMVYELYELSEEEIRIVEGGNNR
jgi:prefoldin subunit 5